METHPLGSILLFCCYAGVPVHAFFVAKALRETKQRRETNRMVLVLMPVAYFFLMCVAALLGASPESPLMKVFFAVFLLILASSMHVGLQMHGSTDDHARRGN